MPGWSPGWGWKVASSLCCVCLRLHTIGPLWNVIGLGESDTWAGGVCVCACVFMQTCEDPVCFL